MSKRLPSLKARDVVRVLEKLGFFKARQRGSHLFLKHSDGRFTIVPVHKGEDISRGLLYQILKEAKVTPEEFLQNF